MEENANAGLWVCSSCGSPPAERVDMSHRYFAGEVCDTCGRVLCDECVKSLTGRICQCGGLIVRPPFDLRKKPLSQTKVDARAEGEMPESAKQVFGCLILLLIVLAVFAAAVTLPIIKALRYAVITVGIIVATVGLTKKKMGLLFLGAAIIVAGQYLE